MIQLNKNQKIIVSVIFTIVIIVIIYYIWTITQNTENEDIQVSNEYYNEKRDEKIIDNNIEIVVHIAGAVENEGIQKLPENSRVADAIEAAGGLTSDANADSINLAQKIVDGQKIYIPNNNEEIEIIESNSSIEKSSDLVNINTATQTELEMLPGIGPSTATKIINYRKENGKFKEIEDLQNVSGIGDSKYTQIKDKITV